MLNSEKITKENLDNELSYIFNNITYKNRNTLLNNFIGLLFKYNGLKISTTTIKHTFNVGNNFNDFIYNNIDDNVIDNVDDLKFYILNEINLIMPNDEYLYNRFLLDNENKGIYKEFNNNFKFERI